MKNKVHKQNVASVIAWFHTTSQNNDNWALRIESDAQTFPKSEGRTNDNNKCEQLLDELSCINATFVTFSLFS